MKENPAKQVNHMENDSFSSTTTACKEARI
jgi:hypothetical protein